MGRPKPKHEPRGQAPLRHCLMCHAGPFEGSTCPECDDDDTAPWPAGAYGRGYPEAHESPPVPPLRPLGLPPPKSPPAHRRR